MTAVPVQITDPARAASAPTPTITPLLPAWFRWSATAMALALTVIVAIVGVGEIWYVLAIAGTILCLPSIIEAWWGWSEARYERICTEAELASLEVTA